MGKPLIDVGYDLGGALNYPVAIFKDGYPGVRQLQAAGGEDVGPGNQGLVLVFDFFVVQGPARFL